MSDIAAEVITRKAAAELRGWNWGAFWLCWIWGLSNKTYIALLGLVPGVNIIMAFILGAMGNRWAWKNRSWTNMEQFRQVQKIWSAFGWGLAAGTLLGILLVAAAVAILIVPVFF